AGILRRRVRVSGLFMPRFPTATGRGLARAWRRRWAGLLKTGTAGPEFGLSRGLRAPRRHRLRWRNRDFKIRLRPVHPDLQEAIEFHHDIIKEGSKALVGYDTAKALANVVLLSEIPTTYDKDEQRQVNAGNLLLRGVP